MINAIEKTGFFIPAEMAGKLGELQAATDLSAYRLKIDAPHLADILSEWHVILRNLHASTYYVPVPKTVEVEVVA
jgi:hypothetical protein